MSKLRNLAGRFKTLNINTLLDSAIMQTEDEALDMNVAQLAIGEYSDGDELHEYENEDYAIYKQGMGSKAPFGVADLILEGDFTRGFFAKIKKNSIEISSTDSKTSKLEEKYSHFIFGLQPKNRLEWSREYILPYLQSNIKSHLKI